MSLLDKQTMTFFADELTKEAIIVPLAKGVLNMVVSTGKAAGKASAAIAKNTNTHIAKSLAGKTDGVQNAIGLGHRLGAGVLTTGLAGAAVYGGHKGLKTFQANQGTLNNNTLGSTGPAGIQQL